MDVNQLWLKKLACAALFSSLLTFTFAGESKKTLRLIRSIRP
jgi:hypothetical protein